MNASDPIPSQATEMTKGESQEGKERLARMEEVTAQKAAVLLSVNVRHVYDLCREGKFKEGIDWRRDPYRPKQYRLKIAAVLNRAMQRGADNQTLWRRI